MKLIDDPNPSRRQSIEKSLISTEDIFFRYEMHYKQRITTEDVFLQMGNKNPSSASCEDLVINIQLPETKLSEIILDITKSFLDCRSPK